MLLSSPPNARARWREDLVFGPNSPLVELLRASARIAPSDATVLLSGETGTGKEVFARFIHQKSTRAGGPLVPVSCGAIPETLLESELFGYVRGAFTGAVTARRGRVALAQGGTLFLDEVGELSLSLQVKLLRLLQERCYEPIGSSESIPGDFRLIAATNRDLSKDVESGRFRRDLYYRLLVCPMELPPLRSRRGDISILFKHFWEARGELRPVDIAVIQAFECYDWPGNVRELENIVERLAVCCEGLRITVSDLPLLLQNAPPGFCESAVNGRVSSLIARLPGASAQEARQSLAPGPNSLLDAPLPVNLPEMMRKLEEAYISTALTQTHGNKKAAAEMLGLQRTTLVEKLRRRNREASTQ